MTISDRKDCNDVENFIWNCIRFDFGQFSGIKQLTLSNIKILKYLCEKFIIKESIENKGK